MTINNFLQFRVYDVNISLWELACNIARCDNLIGREQLLREFERLDKFRNLMLNGIFNGWEDWNWARAIELGWLSNNDLEMFEDEIRKEQQTNEPNPYKKDVGYQPQNQD